MKKLITGILLFFSISSFSQEIKEIKMSEVKYEINTDTTSMTVSINNILLNGKYKIIDDKFPTRYVLTEFINGKAEGESKSIHDGILVGKKYFKNGLPNGESIVYDNTGKTLMWRIPKVNGKSHGIAWFGDEGEVYYWKGERVSKEEFKRKKK